MLVLFESPAGYAIFKLADEKKLLEVDNLFLDFETPEKANRIVKLKHFEKFNSMTDALSAATAAIEGKMSKRLKKLLKKIVVKEAHDQLAVADAKLGNVIKEKLQINCVSSSSIQELMRCIRSQADSLIAGLPSKETAAMALGLAHSLSRYKLKFSPDKIDTMIIQAVSLLDDLDKELNNYIMRCKEWYGWHFPELSKIIADNTVYVQTVSTIGMRTNVASCDLSDILPEDLESKVKEMAEISMGTEISEDDMNNIMQLCNEITEMQTYRTHLYNYLKNRMMAVAPNLTVLVGELVGARLISHAGSLLNLAKHPASTVQILGAEKALFRALKTKHDTPKYGLIYHAQLVGQTNSKNKGKVSRMLAGKAALACRVDALGEDPGYELGAQHKAKLEARLKLLEEGGIRRISGTGKVKAKWEKYENKSEIFQYQTSQDSTLPSSKKRKFDDDDDDAVFPVGKKIKVEEDVTVPTIKSEKKKKHKLIEEVKMEPLEEKTDEIGGNESLDVEKKKRKKKEKHDDSITTKTEPLNPELTISPTKSEKKKKKQKLLEDAGMEGTEDQIQNDEIAGGEKKKKKKRKHDDSNEISTQMEIQTEPVDSTEMMSPKSEKKKKKKQEIIEQTEIDQSQVEESLFSPSHSEKKKKKKKKHDDESFEQVKTESTDLSIESGKKKKKKQKNINDQSL